MHVFPTLDWFNERASSHSVQRRKTNRFSHAYIHDSNNAYQRMALRDFSLQSYPSVASMLQIQKITEGVTYLSLRSLKFRPSLDLTTELGAAIA